MALNTRGVQSQVVINVSQDSFSDPILENTPPEPVPSPPQLNGETGIEDRVEESLTYEYVNGSRVLKVPSDHPPEHLVESVPVESGRDGPSESLRSLEQHVATSQRINNIHGDTQAVAAHLYSGATARIDAAEAMPHAGIGDSVEDDLYGATPPRKSQVILPKSHERRGVTVVPQVDVVHQRSTTRLSGLPRPFPQPETNVLATRIRPSLAESAIPHTISMAPASKAVPSTGKLPPAGGALTALRERKQRKLSHSSKASAKLFDAAEAEEGPSTKSAGDRARRVGSPAKGTSRAPKAKDKMKSDFLSPKDIANKSEILGIPQAPSRTETASRKRKAEPENVVGSKSTNASGTTSKRAKAAVQTKPDVSAPSRQPVAPASGMSPSRDVFDLPESPAKVGPSRVTNKCPSKFAAGVDIDAVQANIAAPKKASVSNKVGRHKVTAEENGGPRRNLRPRKPMQQLPLELDKSEEDFVDADRKVASPDHAVEADPEVSSGNDPVHSYRHVTKVNYQTKHITDEPTAEPKVKHGRSVAAASIETTGALPANLQPSGSQLNAIILSDNSELSSSIDQISPPPETLPAKSKKRATRPETPAAIESSPPKGFSRPGSQSLRGTGRSRKTQIITFDKTGPLNQGALPKSWNSNVSVPPLKVPVNWGSSTGGIADLARMKASSVATSARSGKSNIAAPPSNVALDVYDALAGLSKSRPQGRSNAIITVSTVRIPTSVPAVYEAARHMNQDAVEYEVDDSGFHTINDLETFVNSPSPGQQLNTELKHVPTASQVIMPPPTRKDYSLQNATKVTLPCETRAHHQNTTESAMLSRVRGSKSQVPVKAAQGAVQTAAVAQSSAPTSKSEGKRPCFTGLASERPAKRAKVTSPQDTLDADCAVQKSQEQSTKSMTGTSAQTGPKLKPGCAVEESTPLQTNVEQPSKIVQLQQANRVRRKQERQFSQNSQTVDVNGSPVPPDMEVTELATVLETFSQQPDESSRLARQSLRRAKPAMNAIDPDEEDAYSLPPSYQPRPGVPNNTKARPGPSGSSSKTIRHVKLTKTESDVFMDKRMKLTAPSDPFASSGESRGIASPVKQKAHLLERTIDFAQEIGQFAALGRVSAKESLGFPEKISPPLQAMKSKTSESIVVASVGPKFASDLDRQVAALREHTALTRAAEEDPDRTLVNDCSQETEVSKGSPSASSSVSSSDATPELMDELESDSQSSDDGEDDLRVWRKGLKPHQLRLYEELVKIARVVTGYVTRQESSAEVMIDENYRRELIMVEQEEEVRKKQYKQYMANLRQKKNEKIRELLNLDKVLQGVLDASAVCWKEHCQGRAAKERANQKIADLISSWS